MKHRDTIQLPAIAIYKPDGWSIRVIFPGAEIDFFSGPDKPELIDRTIRITLEYTVPDAQS